MKKADEGRKKAQSDDAQSKISSTVGRLTESFSRSRRATGQSSVEDTDRESVQIPTSSTLRRKTVFAPSYDPGIERSVTDLHQKNAEEIKRIREALRGIPMLAGLDESTMQQVIMAMENRTVVKGTDIIKEGDEGDYFYIIEKGKYEASQMVHGKKHVIKAYNGSGSFGELALLYNQPRSATVTATTDGVLWALSQKNFKKTVARNDLQKRKKIIELISKVDILKNLSEDEKLRLAEALESKTYSKGEKIFKEGEAGDGMYFIEQGLITIYVGEDPVAGKLKTLKPAEYFGELSLLTQHPRAATAVAETDATIVFLCREAFERLLGNCDSIMRRNAKTYDKQMKKLMASGKI